MATMQRRSFLSGAAAASLVALVPARSRAQTAQKGPNRALFQVTDNDPARWNMILSNMTNLREGTGGETVEIELIAYGPGILMLKADSAVRQRIAEAANDTQRLQLIIEREPVARLHFHRRTAGCGEPHEPRRSEGEQFVFGSGAQIADRRLDTSAALRDLLVRDAGCAQLLLLVARAPEHRVSVGVDEAWREDATAAVDDGRVPRVRAKLALRRDGGDGVTVHEHRHAGANAGVGHLGATARSRWTGARHDLACVKEEKCRRHATTSGAGRAITSRTRESRSGACASPRHA